MPTENYVSPKASNLPKHAVYKLAENVANQLEFEPGGDLMPVLGKLGGRLSYVHFGGFGETDSGSLLVHGEGDFEIKVAVNTSPTRDRFTIAHEIGHYVLHYLWPRSRNVSQAEKMIAARYGSERTEWEANWFAAAFLMPEVPFRTRYTELDGDLPALSEQFGVSVTAARVRAQTLGLPVN